MKKKIAISTLIAFSVTTLSACVVVEVSKQSSVNDLKDDIVKEDLSGFIYQNMKEPLYFAGTFDYVHALSVKEVKEGKEVKEVTSDISLYNLEESAKEEERAFYHQNLRYTIHTDSIIEHLEQANYDDPKNFVTDKVVLKTPLKKGNEWTQNLELGDGIEYTAKTKIEKVEGKKGERKISTVTTIEGEGFEDYPNQEYKEKAVYEEGNGLISFERFYPNESGGFIFEYHIADKKE